MKNQYFGDIDDYCKYGLLRMLQSKGNDRLLVAWMLTPDDGSRHGGSRSYLQDPDTWMRYDPRLFTGLAGLLRATSIPDVSLIERSTLLPMNIILWVLQIVLAIKLLSVAYTHALRPDPAKMERGRQRLGAAAGPLLALIALCAFAGGVALVLPAAIRIMTWLVPWAAAFIGLTMLASVGFHVSCRESPKIWVSLILFALAAFVAYGRWVVAPL